MNLEFLRRQLLAAARTGPSADDVPAGFEERIMRRVRMRQRQLAYRRSRAAASWHRFLWPAFAPCLGMLLAAGVGLWTSPRAVEPWEQQMQAVLMVELELPPDSP